MCRQGLCCIAYSACNAGIYGLVVRSKGLVLRVKFILKFILYTNMPLYEQQELSFMTDDSGWYVHCTKKLMHS